MTFYRFLSSLSISPLPSQVIVRYAPFFSSVVLCNFGQILFSLKTGYFLWEFVDPMKVYWNWNKNETFFLSRLREFPPVSSNFIHSLALTCNLIQPVCASRSADTVLNFHRCSRLVFSHPFSHYFLNSFSLNLFSFQSKLHRSLRKLLFSIHFNSL